MKDFEYYRVANEEYWGWEAEKAYKESLIEEINNTPLTKDEREKRLKDVPRLVKEKRKLIEAPAKEKQKKLDVEFWEDARNELCYTSFLDEEGIRKLEHMAYEDGHSHGYSSIYEYLDKYNDILRIGMQHSLPPR